MQSFVSCPNFGQLILGIFLFLFGFSAVISTITYESGFYFDNGEI